MLLPVGDPAVLWRHTVCLNTIIHRLQYTLTVAVCVRVPRKSVSTGVDYYYDDDNTEEFGFDDGQDQEYDLQVLSRHVHVSFSHTYLPVIFCGFIYFSRVFLFFPSRSRHCSFNCGHCFNSSKICTRTDRVRVDQWQTHGRGQGAERTTGVPRRVLGCGRLRGGMSYKL